ncbi:uncharacterized protein AMSG_01607 [Thecamonas trahens ATCC 50062]|uniref:CUB domain-containing protein n=1 Tax=Thecamonas trahens ATCC 50062 TaxID=461836 RepID=A0A0L0DRV6_THETB|nr:hypothetical protein AMSG_01607 [Thecamonas trahens ATCC 50062]KNC54756.1 hypothetical protein AMSG_01607 [Thecamonas trahens ATCC 50062]|eukprot:XP_013761656.1 hypothetical protein AMSG_01607 [Thecamonas trahens ATCC 50062]
MGLRLWQQLARMVVVVAVVVAAAEVCAGQCAAKTVLTAVRHEQRSFTDGTSPSTTYGHSLSCAWLLEAENATDVVNLEIVRLQTECGWDAVFVYDGPDRDAPQLAALSGQLTPHTVVVSTGRYMLVHFHSDLNEARFGWELAYSSSPCPANCSGLDVCGSGAVCNCPPGLAGPACASPASLPAPAPSTPWQIPHARSGANVMCGGAECVLFGGESLDARTFADVWHLDAPPSSSDPWLWTALAPLPADGDDTSGFPVPVTFAAASVVNETLRVAGGRKASGDPSGEMWELTGVGSEATVGNWTFVAVPDPVDTSHPSQVYAAASAVLASESTWFVFGGYLPDGGFSDKLWAWQLGSGDTGFELVATLAGVRPEPRAHASLTPVTLGRNATEPDALMLFGGTELLVAYTSDVWLYYPARAQWARIMGSGTAGTPQPQYGQLALPYTARSGASYVFLLFGKESPQFLSHECYANDVMVFDVARGLWHTLPPVPATAAPLARTMSSGGVVATSNYTSLVVVGGFHGVSLDDVWEYKLALCAEGDECPYGSPLHPPPSRCVRHSECTACAGDPGCGWCAETGLCEAEAGSCSSWLETTCPADECSAHTSCVDCVADPGGMGCSWFAGTQSCGSGSGGASECPLPCTQRQSCEDCIADSSCQFCPNNFRCTDANTFSICGTSVLEAGDSCPAKCEAQSSCATCTDSAIAQGCMWCGRMESCILLFTYQGVSPYADCFDWVFGANTCPVGCEQHAECGTCTADPSCGWCPNSGKCVAGDFSGPDNGECGSEYAGPDVTPLDLEWDFVACACAGTSECGACVEDPRCGWCATTARCHRANGTDVLEWDAVCPEAFDVGECHNCTAVAEANGALGCASCTSDLKCGWCEASGECLRGGPSGSALCPSTPVLAGWDYGQCRSCPTEAECEECTAESHCGYCVVEDKCVRGDTLGPFGGQCGVRSGWDYSACNTFCQKKHATCSECVADDKCGWCCDSGTCSAGEMCVNFHETACPTWCVGLDDGPTCVTALGGGAPTAGVGLCLGDGIAAWSDGYCPADCSQGVTCESCAILDHCGWCGDVGECRTLLSLETQPCANWLSSRCDIELPYSEAIGGPSGVTASGVLVIYALTFFIGTVFGVGMLVCVVRRFEDNLRGPNAATLMQQQRALLNMRAAHAARQQQVPPILRVVVPAPGAPESAIDVPPGASQRKSQHFCVQDAAGEAPVVYAVLRQPTAMRSSDTAYYAGDDDEQPPVRGLVLGMMVGGAAVSDKAKRVARHGELASLPSMPSLHRLPASSDDDKVSSRPSSGGGTREERGVSVSMSGVVVSDVPVSRV